MAQVVHTLRNDSVSVTLFDDGSFMLGEEWRSGRIALQETGSVDVGHVWPRTGRSICEQYPGRFRVIRDGSGFRVTVKGREFQDMGSFHLELSIEGPWVEFAISDIDEEIPTLTFPPPIVSESLVLPRGVGQWVRKPLADRHFWGFYGQLTMRFFGGLSGKSGWICVFEEGHADAGVMAAEMTASPCWMKTLGHWPGVRRVRYRLTDGGYVGIAKAYRLWAKEHGLFRSLKEKLEENPLLGKLHGGRILSFMQATPVHAENFEERMQAVPPEVTATDGHVRVNISHDEVLQAIQDARAKGVEKGLAVVRGWIRDGYDASHPDIWPPAVELGPIEGLQTILGSDGPVLAALHDNYQDIYRSCPSFPSGIIQDDDGRLMAGGVWAGGQCYILNARDGLRYARRNWPLIKSLGPKAMFVDTITAVRLYQSYELGNELTRTEDEALKVELMRLYREDGQILGSEEAADFGIPYLDWYEGRHARVAGESIPLWPLVFHDCAFNARYRQGDAALEGSSGWLTEMLWGYMLLVGHREFGSLAEHLEVDRWHGRVGTEEMVSHQYLSEDGLVERTEFESAAITVNFSDEDREGLPASAYRIEG